MNEPFAYDQVEYPSLIHPQMHPSRLAAIARLHGIRAAAPGSCRLLEVGCGDGLQLITLAMAYPKAASSASTCRRRRSPAASGCANRWDLRTCNWSPPT